MYDLEIWEYLEEYCIEVGQNEDPAIVDLMMDSHKCIEYKEVQYYIPKESSYSDSVEKIRLYLIENFLL